MKQPFIPPILTGLGCDSHRLGDSNKPLILGGVKILQNNGPFSNSDGDAIIHAICNAFEIAAQSGSIACYADSMCQKEGITDSAFYLDFVQNEAIRKGFELISVSVSVEAKTPQLEPFSAKIKERLSQLLGIKKEFIGLTFTSGEDLTQAGLGKGISVLALANFREIK
jgi:2-C-methyl-D-erythritol 2,4-cyclodiphosphate synthase